MVVIAVTKHHWPKTSWGQKRLFHQTALVHYPGMSLQVLIQRINLETWCLLATFPMNWSSSFLIPSRSTCPAHLGQSFIKKMAQPFPIGQSSGSNTLIGTLFSNDTSMGSTDIKVARTLEKNSSGIVSLFGPFTNKYRLDFSAKRTEEGTVKTHAVLWIQE